MRQHHAFRLAGRAGSEDQRSDALRVNLLRQQRDAFVFSLLRPATRRLLRKSRRESVPCSLQLLAQIGMILVRTASLTMMPAAFPARAKLRISLG